MSIRFELVSKRYAEGREALVDISFEIGYGEMVYVTGHSGAGKSTLLKLLALIERPSEGYIEVFSKRLADVRRRGLPAYRRRLGLVFQDHRLLMDRSAFDNVALPMRLDGVAEADIAPRVSRALEQVGLGGREPALPGELSTGEQQRLGIARAMVGIPDLLLADELNRTPPKTQAALLEAMQEQTVSYGGVTRPLPQPFFVLATQNPIEQAGTYPLPEAQLDRFLLQLKVDYPSEAEERAILALTTGSGIAEVPSVLDGERLLVLRRHVREVHLSEDLLSWITRLVRATRPGADALPEINQWLRWGAGPRAGQALVLGAKARALLHGRLAATREDVQALAAPVLRHRLLLSFLAEAEQRQTDEVVQLLLQRVPAPG